MTQITPTVYFPHTLAGLENVLNITKRQPDVFSKDVLPGKHLSCWKQSCKLTVGEAESLKNDARCLHGDKMRLFEGSHLRFPGLAAAVGLKLVSLKKSIDTSAQDPNRTDPTREMKLDTTGMCTSHLMGKSSALFFIKRSRG